MCPLSFKDNNGLPERYVSQTMEVRPLPPHHCLVNQVLDVFNKRTYALYMKESDYPTERILKLAIVFDWKSSKSIALNIGLIRVCILLN